MTTSRAAYFGLASSAPTTAEEVERRARARQRYQADGLRNDEANAANGAYSHSLEDNEYGDTALHWADEGHGPRIRGRYCGHGYGYVEGYEGGGRRDTSKWIHAPEEATADGELRTRSTSVQRCCESEVAADRVAATPVVWSTVELQRSQQAHPFRNYCDYLNEYRTYASG